LVRVYLVLPILVVAVVVVVVVVRPILAAQAVQE
jgi:hypothetical protein